MKKTISIIALCILMVLSTVVTVDAEQTSQDKAYGLLTFIGNVPSDLGDVNIIFEIINTQTDEHLGISLSYLNGYETSFLAEFGIYQIVEGSGKVTNSDNKELNCTVDFEPFMIGTDNPNRDWSWDIDVNVIKNFSEGEPAEKNEIEDAIRDYLTGGNDSHIEDAGETNKNEDGNTLTIPADNKYFPNMTLTEIKQWYVDEVEKFIATGMSEKTLEEYQKSLGQWADYVSRGQENQAEIKYRVYVEKFNESDTLEFYEIQKKTYDFVKEYEESTGLYLNFENWDMVDIGTVEPTITPSVNEGSDNEDITVEPTVTPATNENADSGNDVPSATPGTDEENEERPTIKEKLLDALKKSWFSVLMLVIVLGGGMVISIKKNKSDDE